MNKKKTGILVSSLAAIAVCSSLIAGSTFALFTSESEVNIAVTSGNVSVTATVDKDSVQTTQLNSEWKDGTANTLAKDVKVESGSVALNNLVPGDGVKFDIKVANESSVTVKYRTALIAENDDGLLAGLSFNLGGEAFNGSDAYGVWTTVEAGSATVTVPVEITLPEKIGEKEVGNEYEGKSCTIKYFVEAVQGNAIVKDAFTVTHGDVITGYATLANAFDAAQDNDIIDLNTDCTLYTGVHTFGKNVTFNGNKNAVVLNLGMANVNANYGFIFGGQKWADETHTKTNKFSAGEVVINDLTVTGNGFTAIQLEGFDGGICKLNNVDVAGQFTYNAINFNSSNGGILTGCTVKNNLPDRNAIFFNNEFKLGSLGIFANRNINNPVTLVNSTVDTLYVNTSEQKEINYAGNKYSVVNHTGTKVLVNDNSTVDYLITSGKNIQPESGDFVEFYAVENSATVENILLCGNNKLPRLLNDEDTYVIRSADYMVAFANEVNCGNTFAGKTVVLSEDIDLAGIEWTPIGTNNAPFAGVFDGNEKTISNLTVNCPEQQNVGLFGFIDGGTVKNVNVFNASVKGYKQVGVISGGYIATIENCKVTGTIQVEGSYKVGGIIGETYGTVNACTVTGNENSYIKGVFSSGEDNAEGDNVGGIIGYVNEYWNTVKTHTSDCLVENITISGTRKVGGVAGYLNYWCAVRNCSVKNVTLSCNATQEYVNANSGKILFGGIVGEATSAEGGHQAISGTVENVTINVPIDSVVGWDKDYLGGIRGINVDNVTDFVDLSGCEGSVTVNIG